MTERLGNDADVHAAVDAVFAVSVAELVRGEAHPEVTPGPPRLDPVDDVSG
jgi:hypothetical protein